MNQFVRMFQRRLQAHARKRGPMSHFLSEACRSYYWAYLNNDLNMHSNGELFVLDLASRVNIKMIFDVGANSGGWTIEVLRRFPDATVHAFEIVPQQFRILEQIVAGKRVIGNMVGLSDNSGIVKVKFHPDQSCVSTIYTESTMFDSESTIVDCNVTTGDNYCDKNNINTIDILKIDTEGHDFRVLSGFSKKLRHNNIYCIQWEHNLCSVYSKTLLKDYYDLLSEMFLIGRVMPGGIEFQPYNILEENFVYSNFWAVAKSRSDIIEAVRLR